MPTRDQICFVQFIHPGGEHRPDAGLSKRWNTTDRPHKRKFLRQAGKWIADGRLEHGEMMFWGEWEPESEAEIIDKPVDHGPHYIYQPYYVPKAWYKGLQNTDPFIFGERFCYTWCQQRPAAQLQHLSAGSLILFGSCQDRKFFVLDTAFVVDRWIDHTKADHLRTLEGAVPQTLWDASILPGYFSDRNSCVGSGSGPTWRLYFGATRKMPLRGMYSFFPCQPYEAQSRGFARPRIDLREITGSLNQGRKYGTNLDMDKMKLLWDEVVRQVRGAGLALGVFAKMPRRRSRIWE